MSKSRSQDHAPLIGEPIPDLPRTPITPFPADTDLDSLSDSELISLALRHGVDARDLLGEKTCKFHTGNKLWKELPENRIMVSKLQVGISVVWCSGCFSWWRLV